MDINEVLKKDKVMPGDIFFTMDNSIISRAIRLVETGQTSRNVPSHCGIVSYIDNDDIHILEASFSGIREATLSIYSRPDVTLWLARMKGKRDIYKGLEWAREQIGRKYDYASLVGILARASLRLLGHKVYKRSKWIKNFLDSKQKFRCSEFTELYADETDGRLWHGNIGWVTPFDEWRSKELDIYDKQDRSP